jgi:uncharacterized repeat protein (TIGR03803 family)
MITRTKSRAGMLSAAQEGILVAVSVFAILIGASAQAQSFAVLHKFAGSPDGATPLSGLIRDTAGNLYGITQGGGAFGYGTVFEVDAAGTETLIYSFAGSPDGAYPTYGGLLRDTSGNLYGVTDQGGAFGYGTVFEVDAAGTETVIYSFAGSPDGAYPMGRLIRDTEGNFYGITNEGGASNFGTVFKLDVGGTEGVLYSFAGSPDGAYPMEGVIRDTEGNFYGTTQQGGSSNFGTVFKLSTSGAETVLHAFTRVEGDGGYPNGPLVRDSKGNLYDTTQDGGGYSNGTVFKLSKAGKETVLYAFVRRSGGTNPIAGLVRDSKGYAYGTTEYGGVLNNGTVFKLSKTGKEAVLHSFKGTDGAYPYAVLVRDSKGNFYGTSSEGGNSSCNAPYGCGVVFRVTP